MNKVALVTGSTSGIGLGIVEHLLANYQDYIVVVAGTNEASVEDTLNALKEKYDANRIDGVELVVNDSQSVTSAFEYISSKYGKLDLLYNNAGVNPYRDENESSVLSATSETLLKTMEVNTIGAMRVMQHAAKIMVANSSGRIINTSTEMASLSILKSDYYPLSPSYRTSKIALNGISLLFAKELEGTGVTVNTFSPGWTKTSIGGDDAPFTVDEAIQTAIYLGTDESVTANGKFFAEMRKFGGPIELSW